MDEQASFEPQAVLDRGRAGRSRLLAVLTLAAFAVVAWAGLSGPRADVDQAARAEATPATQVPAPSATSAPAVGLADYPSQVLGIRVHRVGDVPELTVQPDDEIAVAGWYLTTSITQCPQFKAIYRDGALPELRPALDPAAFCVRSGVLFASRPDLEQRVPTNNLEDNRSKSAGLPVMPVTLVTGIVAPAQMDVVGSDALPVVVLARFVDSAAGCGSPAPCRRGLAVDRVAWADGHATDLVIGADSSAPPGQPRVPADGVNLLTGG